MGWRVGGVTVLLLALAAGPAVAGTDVAALVQKVQQRYDATASFTASVTQEMTVTSVGKTVNSQGTVTFKKPGKMRWELDAENPQIIVADGHTLWLYQPNEQQVLKAPFSAAFHSATPISFLTGVGRIAEDFEVTLDAASDDGPTVHLVLVPRRDADSVGRMRLTVARDSGDILGAEIRDPLGNVSRLRFDDIKRNTVVPDSRFVFTVPAGVDVITAPMQP